MNICIFIFVYLYICKPQAWEETSCLLLTACQLAEKTWHVNPCESQIRYLRDFHKIALKEKLSIENGQKNVLQLIQFNFWYQSKLRVEPRMKISFH